MGNAFDFELTATDQASASIQRIEEAVKNLILISSLLSVPL